MEEKVTYTEYNKLHSKIKKEMTKSKEREKEIKRLEEELEEEIRPIKVEKGKILIETKKAEKEEFDEITKNAIRNAKKQILILKKEGQDNYEQKILEFMKRKDELEAKKKSFIQTNIENIDSDKLKKIEESTLKGIEKIQEEREMFIKKHQTFLKNIGKKEDEISKFAITMGISAEIGGMSLEEINQAEANEMTTRQAEEETRAKAEEEARTRAEEEARARAEEESRTRAEEEARAKAEEEARAKAEEEARARVEEEARAKAEEEARARAEEEARARAEEEARARAEQEEKRQQEEFLRILAFRKQEEERKRAEEDRARDEENQGRQEGEDEHDEEDDYREIDNSNIKIEYNAINDIYKLTNINANEDSVFKREEIDKVDLQELSERTGIDIDDLMNVDPWLLGALNKYDIEYNTNKLDEYIKEATLQGRGKDERKRDMEDINISISYDLKGLYDEELAGEEDRSEYKPVFSREERKELLRIANRAKELGLANVRKGLVVIIREKIDNFIDKIMNFKNALLPKGRDEEEREEGEEARGDVEERTSHQKFMDKFKARVNHKKARENAEEEREEQEREEETI